MKASKLLIIVGAFFFAAAMTVFFLSITDKSLVDKSGSTNIGWLLILVGALFYFVGLFHKDRVLRPISKDQVIFLRPLEGTRFIGQLKGCPNVHVDQSFDTYGLNRAGAKTGKTFLQIHELVRYGTAVNIFRALPGRLQDKWLSQDQIREYCDTMSAWMTPESSTMFFGKQVESRPIDEKNLAANLVVIVATAHPKKLSYEMYEFSDDIAWYPWVPKLRVALPLI